MFAEKQTFPAAAGALPLAEQARRQDAGVVEDEQVAWGEQIGQVGEVEMAANRSAPLDGKQARGVTPRVRAPGRSTPEAGRNRTDAGP